MRELKKYLLFLLVLLCVFLEGEALRQPQQPILRLHVRAHSDSPRDQAVKYLVRDHVLVLLDDCLQQADSAGEAQRKIAQKLPEIEATAAAVVKAAGFNYQVAATLGPAFFPTRLYGEQVYRAGEYEALQIYLGDGAGQNWWCVLFPPLCFIEMSPEEEGKENVAVAPQKFTPPPFKSRIINWFRKIFRHEGA
ncbi:MAG: stage II sporulation protein R [Firmicutes bacterium]|nr:stage II sporulation protein R [Bacillota bacterium]